jgi:hypothetical protein
MKREDEQNKAKNAAEKRWNGGVGSSDGLGFVRDVLRREEKARSGKERLMEAPVAPEAWMSLQNGTDDRDTAPLVHVSSLGLKMLKLPEHLLDKKSQITSVPQVWNWQSARQTPLRVAIGGEVIGCLVFRMILSKGLWPCRERILGNCQIRLSHNRSMRSLVSTGTDGTIRAGLHMATTLLRLRHLTIRFL